MIVNNLKEHYDVSLEAGDEITIKIGENTIYTRIIGTGKQGFVTFQLREEVIP